MKQVLLSDVCEINPRTDSGISDDSECSFVPMEYVDEVSGAIANTSIRRVGDVKKGYTFFKNDDVIFAKITPCMENGKCAIGKNLKNGIAFGSTEYHVVRAKEEIIPEWIYHFLRQEKVRQQATGWFRGTAGQQRVPASFLEELKIPLPPLTEQKRIASLLARADRLRQLRRTAHDLGDALLQSVFLEMFGNVKLNQKGWDVFPLEDIVQPGRIITYGIVQAGPHIEDGIPYIRTGDIKEGQIVVDGLLRTSKEIAAKYKRSEVKAGELVMSIRATVGTIAELSLQLDGANLTQGTARISPGSKVNKKFLLYAIRSQGTQKLIEDRTKGATFREITLEALREVPMIVPPLNLQEKFAGVVARVEQMRSRQAESERHPVKELRGRCRGVV
jgi:type I restriction enzyme, S subunit